MDGRGVRGKLADWAAAARANPLFRRGLAGAAVITALDQASKAYVVRGLQLAERVQPCAKNPAELCGQISVSPIFDLTYVENKGASFGLLAGGMASRVLLSILAAGVAGVLIAWLARSVRPLAATGVAFVIGGAVGNLIDRIAYGYVIDFLDFSGLFFPWVFNLADASINVGIALLIIDWWREKKGAGS